MISMIVSNLMPYALPIFKIIYRRGCCRCKRKNYKPNTHLNPEFSMEHRYGTILTTVSICFSYGFAIPMIFIIASFIILTQFIIDKLLITYYYRERVEHNDLLNRTTLRLVKYSIVLFLLFGGITISMNYC
jgi:hypothetical protein